VPMDGPGRWIGARISWRVSVGNEPDVTFDGRIDTSEDIGDGITRVSGALADGCRFVLVTDCGELANS
jgi:hypothetical protein